MDGSSFDTLVRTLVTTTPRRTVLRLLAAGALAAPLARLGLTDSAAQAAAGGRCRKPGKSCNDRKRCCRGARCKRGECRCKGKRQPCRRACCRPKEVCCDGRCYKPRDLKSDPDHCGSCGNACDSGQICAEGTCVTGQGTCQAGQDACVEGSGSCNIGEDCFCLTSIEGETRCGDLGTGGDPCEDDADCAALGPGGFCIDVTGTLCTCAGDVDKCCVLPCLS